jgi:hypothetical protein
MVEVAEVVLGGAGDRSKGGIKCWRGSGSGCLEIDGGVWSDEIAGKTRRLTRVEWRAAWWGESRRKANR